MAELAPLLEDASTSSSSSSSDSSASRRRLLHAPSKAVLNFGEEEELECRGFASAPARAAALHLTCLVFLGFPYLVLRWKPGWRVRLMCRPVPLHLADRVLLTDSHGDQTVERVHRVHVTPSFPKEFTMRPRQRRVQEDGDVAVESRLLGIDARPSHVFFYYHRIKYAWNHCLGTFVRVHALDRGHSLTQLATKYSGYSESKRDERRILFGPNSVEVEVKSYAKLLFEEVLNPFYIFQAFSIILWSFDNYVAYASCILVISIISIGTSLYQTRKQDQSLHDMVASTGHTKVLLCRDIHDHDAELEETDSADLVPGDIIAIPQRGCTMTCDAVLLGGSCIVNESMLTGESVPVTKTLLPAAESGAERQQYHSETHARHTLFAGTTVIQTRNYAGKMVYAVVSRTGFSTSKGELVRSILYPKPIGFKFYQDSIRFLGVLFGVACLGMMYCLYVYVARGSDIGTILKRCLDIFTVVVPPALPAAMTVGTIHAQSRLKKRKIFCISPQRINICGKLNAVCFDKTGTLTEEGLDMYGVTPVYAGCFMEEISDVTSISKESKVLNCLASCHSLTLIDGQLTGDPLDIKMFEATEWDLEEQGQDNSKFDMLMPTIVKPKRQRSYDGQGSTENLPHEVGIVRQFPFNADVARMSVITRALDENGFVVYAKGAPEKLATLCTPESIPEDFEERLKRYTLKGFRVLGIASKNLPSQVNWLKVQRMKRDQAEADLTFLGFLIMQNKLKEETTPVIRELRQAKVRCLMVTGDNLLTAISVARDCHLVDPSQEVLVVEASAPDDDADIEGEVSFWQTERAEHSHAMHHVDGDPERAMSSPSLQNKVLAVTGHTWGVVRSHFPHLLPRLAVRGAVFARMSPEQKAQLVEELQSLGYVASMCGDGANDCGALKAAHVGISLSEAEASVAAPFTSTVADITCVPTVVREGRCALVTSFGVFKYMALYSMIQFVSVLLLYTLKTNLGDFQYLYIDLIITTTVAVTMSWTGAYEKLSPKRPPGSLVTSANIFSILSQIAMVFAFQVGAYFYLAAQPWYVKNDPIDPEAEVIICWETTTVFAISSFQYLALATAFSRGPPYRLPLYKNRLFLTALVVLTAFTAALDVHPGNALAALFQLEFGEDESTDKLHFRISLLALAAMHLMLALLLERILSDSKLVKKLMKLLRRKDRPKSKYKELEAAMRAEGWPRVTNREVDTGAQVHYQPGVS